MNALAEWVLKIVVPPEDRRHILDELDELYQVKVGKAGREEADAWRKKQIWGFVLKALPVFWWKRPLSGFLGLLSNRKRNARELLHLVATLVGERFHLQDIFYIEKETHRRVAPSEIIQQLALRCDVAIVAAAD